MLDHAFGIFNNVPPRIQWAEIDLTFPSDDIFFKTASFDDMVAKSVQPKRRMKIKDAVQRLLAPPASAEHIGVLRQEGLSALDMQMLIHCLLILRTDSYFSNANQKQSSILTSGPPHFRTQCLHYQVPISNFSLRPSKLPCTSGKLSGTKSKPQH